jgi:hypothetical protein
MAKSDAKPTKPVKLDDPLLMVQVTSVQQRFVKPSELPAQIEFERPTAYGWHTVVFPLIHDENTVLELWNNEVFEWIKDQEITRYFWCYAHGVEKKLQNRISPVYFFKDSLNAARMMWRFKGELMKV